MVTSVWDAISRLLAYGQDGKQPSQSVDDIMCGLSATFDQTCDLVQRDILLPSEHKVTVIFIESLVDSSRLYQETIEPLLAWQKGVSSPPTLGAKGGTVTSVEHGVALLLNNCALFVLKSLNTVLYAEVTSSTGRAIFPPTSETTIAGPQEAFVERIMTNLTLVRQRLKTSALKCVNYRIGKKTQTSLYLLYMDGIAPDEMVRKMQDRLSSLHIGEILDVSYLESLIGISPLSPFPQAFYTQRPDKVAGNLLEGRLAILLDGSPQALIAPAAFTDLFQSPADYYSRTTNTVLVRILRLIGFLLATTLPGLYISLVSFDFEILPTNLAIPIASFRAGIPFSPVVEVLLMTVIVDILQEGATRLPTKIGQTLGVVGGFVLGQAVIQAKLVSPLAVIVVATSVIGSFTLPNYELIGLVRIVRYLLIIAAGFLSGIGIAMIWSALFIHMCSLEILGVPYLRPISPLRLEDHSDLIYHTPYRTKEPGLDKRVGG